MVQGVRCGIFHLSVGYHLGKGNLHAASQSDKSAFRLQFEQRIVGISVRQLRRRNPFRDEEEQIIQFFESKSRNKDLVIYDCTSGYPVPFEDICLLEITRLRELYADRVKAIGFSGHHLGIAVDSAAVALGAEWIERHYTLDRTWKGTDHAASLEPDGVRKLARDCRAVAKALTYKKEDILDIEKVQRNKLKKNQVKW